MEILSCTHYMARYIPQSMNTAGKVYHTTLPPLNLPSLKKMNKKLQAMTKECD